MLSNLCLLIIVLEFSFINIASKKIFFFYVGVGICVEKILGLLTKFEKSFSDSYD